MDHDQQRLISSLHATPFQCVLAMTGGGLSAAAALVSTPGASRMLMECMVPYHEAALCDFLGRRPEKFCSSATAEAMAQRALARAEQLAPNGQVVGLGCTSSLATDRPKRGQHRFHLCLIDDRQKLTSSLILAKGSRDREGEELIVSLSILNALAQFCGLSDRIVVPFLPNEQPDESLVPAAHPLAMLYRAEAEFVCQEIDGKLRIGGPRPRAVLCGSFNPLHAGHRRLADVATQKLGLPVAFELGVVNADKPELSMRELRERLRQFLWRGEVWIDRAPMFALKASWLPNTVFVVGSDTAERIVSPRYYGDSIAARDRALTEIQAAGCRFLVAGRVNTSGEFVAPECLPLPEGFRDMFEPLTERDFRVDVSSTQLRDVARDG